MTLNFVKVWYGVFFHVHVYLMIVSCFSITITTPGKKTAIAANAIPPLVSLVDDDTSEVRANSLKVSEFTQFSVTALLILLSSSLKINKFLVLCKGKFAKQYQIMDNYHSVIKFPKKK